MHRSKEKKTQIHITTSLYR